MKRKMNSNIKVEGSGEMKMWGKKKSWRKCKYLKKISECKKNYRKIGNKKEIYIDVKTDKEEYVKSIIYFLYIYIYIYIYI